jgi:uncharacterized membrane protein
VPFLVYGLIAIGVAIVAVVAIGLVGAAVGVSAMVSGSSSGVTAFVGFMLLFVALLLIAALIIGPIIFGSTYAGYKDTLGADDAQINPAYR